MGKYTVKLYKGSYYDRQQQANNDKCVAYVEHHFNSTKNTSKNYTIVVTGNNASNTSKQWGRYYAGLVHKQFNVPIAGDNGIKIGGYGGRGDSNLIYTKMPAILIEPVFISNEYGANIAKNEQDKLAKILVDSIKTFFPNGGKIGFSVGHKYKPKKPNDRGAISYYGDTNEADLAEQVLLKAEKMLQSDENDNIQKQTTHETSLSVPNDIYQQIKYICDLYRKK